MFSRMGKPGDMIEEEEISEATDDSEYNSAFMGVIVDSTPDSDILLPPEHSTRSAVGKAK